MDGSEADDECLYYDFSLYQEDCVTELSGENSTRIYFNETGTSANKDIIINDTVPFKTLLVCLNMTSGGLVNTSRIIRVDVCGLAPELRLSRAPDINLAIDGSPGTQIFAQDLLNWFKVQNDPCVITNL